MAESITCPRCHMTSANPTDIEKGYCGNCYDYTSGVSSRLAFEEFLATGQIPAWRKQALEARAIREAVQEALEGLREKG